MKISVAILCYNHEQFIHKALDSVLAQKLDVSFEIVIGDDASTDQSQTIIREFQSQYPDIIKPILKTKNEGVFNNIMDVLKACNGEYIALLETDDFWTHPHKLVQQIFFLDNNPDYTGCFHNTAITWLDEANNLPNHYLKNFKSCAEVHVYPEEFHPHHLMNSTYIPTSSLVFRKRDYMDELQQLSKINHTLAWGMTFFFIKKNKSKGGKFKYFNEIWSTYVKNGKSLTFTQSGSIFSKTAINILRILLNDPFYKYYKSEIYRGLALQHEIHYANLKAENAKGQKKAIFAFLRYSILFSFYRTKQYLQQQKTTV